MNDLDDDQLAAEVHGVYCEQYLKNFGKNYWTGGDYTKLNEATKAYDLAHGPLSLRGLCRGWRRLQQGSRPARRAEQVTDYVKPPIQPVDAFECVCGHHANDHDFTLHNGRGFCCGGLSESCSCREFRPRPAEEPL